MDIKGAIRACRSYLAASLSFCGELSLAVRCTSVCPYNLLFALIQLITTCASLFLSLQDCPVPSCHPCPHVYFSFFFLYVFMMHAEVKIDATTQL